MLNAEYFVVGSVFKFIDVMIIIERKYLFLIRKSSDEVFFNCETNTNLFSITNF